MKTYPEEARKAVAEAEKQAAVVLHRLVLPFQRENTKLWRDRERIRTALENIKANADEAGLYLKDDRTEKDIIQATAALRELDQHYRQLCGHND